MKRILLLLIFILINARILQQIYLRTNKEHSSVSMIMGNNGGVVNEGTTSNMPKIPTLAWEGLVDSSAYMSQAVDLKWSNWDISRDSSTSDKLLLNQNKLMDRLEQLSNKLKSSTVVWIVNIGRSRQVFKEVISSVFKSVFYLNISEVVTTLLLGRQGQVSSGNYHLFKVTGTQHLLAISGFHLSLFVVSISRLYKNLFSIYTYFFINIVLAGMFFCLVGFSPGLLRAFLMFFISSSSLYFNRQKSIIISFVLSFLISILIDVSMLSSISFQLSYGATFGIIILSRSFKRINNASSLYFDAIPKLFTGAFNYFVDAFIISTVAQISIFPLLAFHFGELSLVSVLASSMISWMIPIIIQTSLVLVILYFVVPFNWFLIVSMPLLFFVTGMLKVLESISFNWLVVEFSYFNMQSVLVIYLSFVFIYSIISVIKYVKVKQNYEKKYNFYF